MNVVKFLCLVFGLLFTLSIFGKLYIGTIIRLSGGKKGEDIDGWMIIAWAVSVGGFIFLQFCR